MFSLSLSWVIGSGRNRRGGSKDDASLDDVLKLLKEALESTGSIALDIMDGPDVGPQSLQVEAEGGRSVLSLGENDNEGYSIRSFTNPSGGEQQVNILGNLWDSKLVCTDPDIVISVFKEFFETGNVSRELLS